MKNRLGLLTGISLAMVACATTFVGGCSGDDTSVPDAANDVTTNDVANDVVVKDSGPDTTVSDASDGSTGDSASDVTTADVSSDVSSDAPTDVVTSDVLNTDGGCDGVTAPWHYYVDPVNGSDTTGTGSGTSGGNASPGCAFKTITHAIAAVLAANTPPVAGTEILVAAGTVSAGETFPIPVPQNVLIQGAGATTIVQPGTSNTAFSFASTASALDKMTLDGQSQTANHGITAGTGSDTTDKATNLLVKDFADDAVMVNGGGGLTIGDGVEITGSGTSTTKASGAHVTDTNSYLIIQPSTAQVHIHDNTLYGVNVDMTGHVKMAGALGATPPSTATILIEKNLTGVFIEQTPGGTNLNDISGVASVTNSADGMDLYGGSDVKVRTSYVVGNSIDGVHVLTNSGVTTGGSDVSKIDLGVANDFGKNKLQDTSTPNSTAGICLDLSVALNQVLYAEGNTFGAIDCTTTNTDGGAYVLTSGNCQSGSKEDYGVAGSQLNSVNVSLCK